MAKMIKHKDSYIKHSTYTDMLKKINRVESCNETSAVVHMINKHGQPVEVKALFPASEVVAKIEDEEYLGEISEFLFSYYIGEV
jgi:hypothetical protein